MTDIIKAIRAILDPEYNDLNIEFYNDCVYFNIYQSEIPIKVDKQGAMLECEWCDSSITTDMLDELTKIARILEDNKNKILACIT